MGKSRRNLQGNEHRHRTCKEIIDKRRKEKKKRNANGLKSVIQEKDKRVMVATIIGNHAPVSAGEILLAMPATKATSPLEDAL